MNWRIIKRKDLNVAKWDHLLDQHAKGLPYTDSWYLDICCTQWEAAVLNDYEAVCALPYNRKKFGFLQLYTPFFIQQLGWVSKEKLSEKSISELLSLIKKRYFFIHYAFNESNQTSLLREHPKRTNLVLDLSKTYEDLTKNYSKGLKYSLNKAQKDRLVCKQIEFNSETQTFLISFLEAKTTGLKSKNFEIIRHLIQYCVNNLYGKLWEVRTEEGQLLSIAFFLTNDQRIVNLFQAGTLEARKANAISYLFDQIIKDNSGKKIIFDFEGSEIETVQQFMKSFGAAESPYPIMVKKLNF